MAAIVNNSGRTYKSAYFDSKSQKLFVYEEKEPTVVEMDVGIIWDRNLTLGHHYQPKIKIQNLNMLRMWIIITMKETIM